MKWYIIILIILGIIGLSSLFLFNPKMQIERSHSNSLEKGIMLNQDIDLGMDATEDYNLTKVVDTQYIRFVVPIHATHYWNLEGNDTYEMIINLTEKIKWNNYIIKINWTDDRYREDYVNVNYTFVQGKLSKNTIKVYSNLIGSNIKFNNLGLYLWNNTLQNWGNINIDLGNKLNFVAVDDTNVSACGSISSAGVYVLNRTLNTSTTSCMNIASNDVVLDLNGYWINMTTATTNTALTGVNIPGSYNNITIKNGVIAYYPKDIYAYSSTTNFSVTNMTLLYSNTLKASVYLLYLSNSDKPNVSNNVFDIAQQIVVGVSYSIYLNGSNGGVYYNNNFRRTKFATGYAMFIKDSNNSLIYNNNATMDGLTTTCSLNYLQNSNNNSIYNNSYNSSGGVCNIYSGLVVLNKSSNNNIYYNLLGASVTNGVLLDNNANNNNIHDNFFENCSYGSQGIGCIFLRNGASNNFFSNNTINRSSQYGIYLQNLSINNVFRDMFVNVTTPFISHVYVEGSLNNTFINVSGYARDAVCDSISCRGGNASLIRQWYYSTNITNSSYNPLAGVNVSIVNVTGDLVYSMTSMNNGLTNMTILTDYVIMGYTTGAGGLGVKTYQTPHIMTASLSGYSNSVHSVNMSVGNNLTDLFIMNLAGSYCWTRTKASGYWVIHIPQNCAMRKGDVVY